MLGSTEALCSRLGYKEAQEKVEVIIKEGRFGALFASCAERKPIGENGRSELGASFPCQQGLALARTHWSVACTMASVGELHSGAPWPLSFQLQLGGITPVHTGSFQTPVVWVFLPQGFSRSLVCSHPGCLGR